MYDSLHIRLAVKLLKTGKSCPLSQLYAEIGLIPARYDIIRIRLLYLQSILTQKEDSMILCMLKLQLKHPKRGDWASTCFDNLIELEIDSISLEMKPIIGVCWLVERVGAISTNDSA